ncbi:MAG: hypothetical protein ACOYM3_24880 [Terrimicrobiaceae bacterium]
MNSYSNSQQANPTPSTKITLGTAEGTVFSTEIVQELLSEEFTRYYPRKYAGVGGWTSPKVPAAVFAIAESDTTPPSTVLDRDTDALLAGIRITLENLLMPTYWIGKDLAVAADKTKPPHEINIDDLQLPLPAALFLLPEKTLTFPNGIDASWMAIGKIRWSFPKADPGEEYFTVVTGAPGVTAVAFIRAGERFTYRDAEYVALDENGNCRADATFAGSVSGDSARSACTSLSAKMCRMSVNLIMMLNAIPRLAEETTRGSSQKPATGKAARRPCSPNWIGQTFKLAAPSLGGHHASPRMHWRRAHNRQQPYGPKLSMRRRIRVQAALVCGETVIAGGETTTAK